MSRFTQKSKVIFNCFSASLFIRCQRKVFHVKTSSHLYVNVPVINYQHQKKRENKTLNTWRSRGMLTVYLSVVRKGDAIEMKETIAWT